MSPKSTNRYILLLHGILAIYSLGGIFSKVASANPFLSRRFILLYTAMLLTYAVYAIGWQQIIKHLPLTSAYASRAITIVWGLIWGVLFFHETISLPKVLGAALVLTGTILFNRTATFPDMSQQDLGEVDQ